MNSFRQVVFGAAMLASVPSSAQEGWIFFNNPDLGAAERMVISPYIDAGYAVTFTALPGAAGSAELGLVRDRSALPCFLPNDPEQMLGTAMLGTGDIGTAAFSIRVDFPRLLEPPAVVDVEVFTFQNAYVNLSLFDENDALIGVSSPYNYTEGTCAPGGIRERLAAVAQDTPVAYAVISTATGHVFVIDNFSWREHLVPVQPTTWGRVKALYRQP